MDHYNRLRFAEHLAPTCQKYGTVPVDELQLICDKLWELKTGIASFCDTIAAQLPARKNLVLLAEDHFDITGSIAAVMFMKHLQGKYDCYLEGTGVGATHVAMSHDLMSTNLIAYLNLFPVTRLDTPTSSAMADALREIVWAARMFPNGVVAEGSKLALLGGNHAASFPACIRLLYAGFDTYYRVHAVQLYTVGPVVAGATTLRLAQDAIDTILRRFPTQRIVDLDESRMQPRTHFIFDVATAVFTFEEVAVSKRCKPD